MKRMLYLLALALSSSSLAVAVEVKLEQIVSREHPQFSPARASLAVGKDGLVYLGSVGPENTAYVVRTTREGTDKFGGSVTYALANAAANKDGILATANGHFAHKVAIYDQRFKQFGDVNDFLVGDHVGWDAPSHVEAGASGDFYGIDQHRDRILRVSPQGKLLKAYAVPREPAGHGGLIDDFRVCERLEAFYVVTRQGPLRVVGFDGQTRWTTPNRVHVSHVGTQGGFDIDDDGNLFVIQPRSQQVVKITADGKPGGETTLQIPGFAPSLHTHEGTITGLRIAGNELLLKRWDATKLFERYDAASGTFKAAVASQHERLAVTYASDVWTAGREIDFAIEFHSGEVDARPDWRIWLRPLHHVDYRELTVRNGQLRVPADLGGIYQIKITPEANGWERGESPDYIVRSWVEVRADGARGSLSVLTPNRRVHFGRGDAIPFSLLARAQDTPPVAVTVKLSEAGGRELATATATVEPGKVLSMKLPPQLTRALRAGEYRLTASAAGLTSVVQPIEIGPGRGDDGFLRMRHGDYGETYPSADIWNAADVVAAHVQRERKLGFNTFVDRIGTHTQIGALEWDGRSRAELQSLVKRLQDDPAAAAPRSVEMASPLLQVMAAYSAYDMQQMAILLYMDVGLPLGGPGHDHRTPEKMAADLQTVTKALVQYPAFRGWSWHANWWIYEQRGSAAATSPEQKAAYEAALKQAKETGKWSAVLDEVSQRRLGFAVEAQQFFKRALHEVAPAGRLKTASAGTYRNVESYPPISFQNVDEVDLQGQFEQIFLPYFPAHAVDFYRRPGKPVWGHPEIWNDDGTGGQVLPELFSMLMRSPDGLGPSGVVPPWTGKTGIREDPRIAHFGTASIFRAMNRVLEPYGGWLSTLDNDDRVAIVASPRQFKIDEWGHVSGRHFARLLEAYVSCLHAHHPASIVFVDDIQPATLTKCKAVLLVDRWVELESELTVALKNAKAAGVAVLHDGTCREELVRGFTPLGISFDTFDRDRHPASDDAAYYRFPQYVRQNLPALRAALDAVMPPAARIENPEVWISQLKSADARYLFVVNNTSVPLEPSQMWRTNLHVASLLPVVERIEITEPAAAIYDVFAMKQVTLQNGAITADLRHLPARLYALLPVAIDSVALRGPSQVAAGQSFLWTAHLYDAAGQPIKASLPLRARLLGADEAVLHEAFVAADAAGAAGEFVAPLNAANAQQLEVTELLSGRTARLDIQVQPAGRPLALQSPHLDTSVAAASATGRAADTAVEPVERNFGPHLRDVIISDDGRTAVLNAMNWDHNLYGVDVGSGKVIWRNKVGNYFAFAPQACSDGFAVQGFDYHAAAGYHLYSMNGDGTTRRRFALHGLPRRLPHRFVPGLINDRENPVNNFAMPADGRWAATAGDLGLAVWDNAGTLLWKQDWWDKDRQPARLAALGPNTLLVAKATTVTAYDARRGTVRWTRELAATGGVREIAVSRNGQTAAVLATTDGGRVFVIRSGKVIRTLVTASDDIDISTEGSRIVAVEGNVLKYFTLDAALQWSFSGDDRLRHPRLTADGSRVAAGSELGTVYVLDADGSLLHERDHGALTVAEWLADGDLLLASWMGKVTRLTNSATTDTAWSEKWSVHLQPAATDVRASLTAKETLPTAQVTGWGNAAAEPLPLEPNLLTETKALIKFVADGSPHIQLARQPAELTDGSPQPPSEPWLDWGDINWFAEANPTTYLQLDTFRTQLRVDAITFVEDAARPDSWLRDASFEYWDAAKEQWTHIQPLLSDRAVHTHRLSRPVEAARFRVVIPRGFCGNLRLAEIVLHGERLGASHPDVIARRPVAVLFDDSDEFKHVYPYHDRWSFQLEGAFHGGRFWRVNADQNIAPTFYPTFGHTVPNWDFEIVEHPQPGQYRWAQWTWKALSPDVKGATVKLGHLRLHAGQPSGEAHLPAHRIAESLPEQWTTVRVDLWQLAGKPMSIQTMYLGTAGGPVAFDQILLARTADELDHRATPSR